MTKPISLIGLMAINGTGVDRGVVPRLWKSVVCARHSGYGRRIFTLKYKRLFPVYEAALYLSAGTKADAVLQDVPKRLEVVYRFNTQAERFNKAGEHILDRQFSDRERAALQERLDRINSWYPDPRAGDRCAIIYLPGRGNRLSYNGRVLGTIAGEDFGRAYFSIWLGKDPACKRLKKNLLISRTE